MHNASDRRGTVPYRLTSGLLTLLVMLVLTLLPLHAHAATACNNLVPSALTKKYVTQTGALDCYDDTATVPKNATVSLCPGWDGLNGEYGKWTIVERVVLCLTSTKPLPGGIDQGLIPAAVEGFFNNDKILLLGDSFSTACIALAIVIFGIRLLIGSVQVIGKDMFILLFKIAGVAYFIENGYDIYKMALDAMSGALSAVSSIMNISDLVADSCPAGVTSYATDSPWIVWDCMFWQMLGVGTKSLIAGGFFSIFVMLLLAVVTQSVTTGIFAAFAIVTLAVYFAIQLVFLIARIVHIYIMAAIGLGFMMVIGFMFVPLVLFDGTKGYFERWLNVCIGYILTPMMLFAFLGIALICMDVAIFTGGNSIMHAVTGSTTQISQRDMTTKDFDPVTGTYPAIKTSIDLARASLDPNKACAKRDESMGGGAVTHMNACEKDKSKKDDSAAVFSLGFNVLNVEKWAARAVGFAGTTEVDIQTWLRNIYIALMTAALMAYILYSVSDYIPTLVNDLVLGGMSSGGIAKERAVGEVAAKATAMVAIETARGALKMGVGVARAVKNAVMHPLDTGWAAAKAVGNAGLTVARTGLNVALHPVDTAMSVGSSVVNGVSTVANAVIHPLDTVVGGISSVADSVASNRVIKQASRMIEEDNEGEWR